MSETLEARRTRLAGLEARDWCRVDCSGCGAGNVVCAPSQTVGALCGKCRAQVASTAATILRLPAETPPRVVWSTPEIPEPEIGSEAVTPETVCGSSCDHDEPNPVTDLHALAIDQGWYAEIQHSRGTPAGARAVVEMWSVRFRRGTWAGYAVRRGDAWKSVCVTGAALPPFLALGVTELREWLADPDACGPAWCDAIRAKVARAALHAKQVACPGAPLCVPSGPWTVDGVGPARLDHTHRGDGGIVKKVSRKEQAGAL